MIIVGIAGGSGSGKTTVVDTLIKDLPEDDITVLPQDAYYKDNSHLPPEDKKNKNFDHPEAVDFKLLVKHLKKLKDNHAIDRPVYSYLSCERQPQTVKVKPPKVLLLEGILIFTEPGLLDLIDVKIFVEAGSDERLSRIIKRDLQERGRGIEEILDRYHSMIKPMHKQFIEPSKIHADLIIPQGGENLAAVEVLSSLVNSYLNQP